MDLNPFVSSLQSVSDPYAPDEPLIPGSWPERRIPEIYFWYHKKRWEGFQEFLKRRIPIPKIESLLKMVTDMKEQTVVRELSVLLFNGFVT